MRVADEAIRAAYPRALATLIRIAGDIALAQDALQEAVERALARWTDGVPREPAAWLVHAGRNILIDQGRKRALERRNATGPHLPVARAPDEPIDVASFRDDMLRLIFTCCHPSLSADSQVALTLRTVVGLSVDEIARAYLVSPKAMERRLTRARRALSAADVPYEVPGPRDLPARLEAVCAVILVLFTEGYSYSEGTPTLRPRLCELAIRLARLVARLFRRDAEVSGLLALLLLQHSHWPARVTDPGRVVTLEEQDRSLWDEALIREGSAIIERALRRRELGPYQVQAAIAAVHCSAPTYAETNWQEIAALYDVLVRKKPTAVVRVNRAVAVSRARGPEHGLRLLRELEDERELAGYHLLHAVTGRLLEETGRLAQASAAYRRALEGTNSEVEREYLSDRLRKIEHQD